VYSEQQLAIIVLVAVAEDPDARAERVTGCCVRCCIDRKEGSESIAYIGDIAY